MTSGESEKDNSCPWCSRVYSRATSLASHMCIKKRRWADKDATHIRLAFRVFQKFYSMTSRATSNKTQEDFIRSQYYEDFVKFGRSCVINEYLDPERYAEWLIRSGKKIKEWPHDATYNIWLLEFIKGETAEAAINRTFSFMTAWALEFNLEWSEYFLQVSPSRAVHDLKSGKVSPWFLYLSNSGGDLLSNFSTEQIKMIERIIDAEFWAQQFKRKPADVELILTACEAAGI